MPLPSLFIRVTHTGVFADGRPNTGPILIPDLDVGYENQDRKVPVYVPFGGFINIPASSRSMLSYEKGGIHKLTAAGIITSRMFYVPESFDWGNLPNPDEYPVGTHVWNTDDNKAMWSDGSSWQSGGVSFINTGAGLTGGPITGSGTISAVPITTLVRNTPGTYSWAKPFNARFIRVLVVGGGAGGAGGSRGAGDLAGGYGGGGGGVTDVTFPAASLALSTITYKVGAGGTGGTGRNTDGPGNFGTAGEASEFFVASNTSIKAYGGNAVTGGAGLYQGISGVMGTKTAAYPTFPAELLIGAGAGGYGGWLDADNASVYYGIGGHKGFWSLGGGLQGDPGGPSDPNGISAPSAAALPFPIGGGGGGGMGRYNANGGNGGNGGLYGGGGGGGGAARSGYISGSGGNGGSGVVVIWTW